MDSDSHRALAELLKGRATAALGTLHDGAPAVSMVPFVFVGGFARAFSVSPEELVAVLREA